MQDMSGIFHKSVLFCGSFNSRLPFLNVLWSGSELNLFLVDFQKVFESEFFMSFFLRIM